MPKTRQGDRTGEAPRRAGWLRRGLPLALIVLVMAVALQQGWHKHLSIRELAENEQALRDFVDARFPLALCTYAALYISVVALSMPGGLILTVTGGFLFGWLVGGMTAVVSATIGATIIFLVARTALGDVLVARAGPWLSTLCQGFRQDAFNYLLFLRLVPAFPFWLVNLAPAILGVRLPVFVLATFIGIIPATFAFAVVGSGLDSAIDAQRAAYESCVETAADASECRYGLDVSALLTPGLLAAFAALGVLALVPVVVKKVMEWRTGSAKD